MLFLDLESQSKVDLPKRGGHVYAADPSTRILCACIYDSDLDRLYAWPPVPLDIEVAPVAGLSPKLVVLDTLPKLSGQVVAHNAWGFDSLVWPQPIDEIEWLDSKPRARRLGYPGGLDALTTRLYGIGKDPRGERLISRWCKTSRSHPELEKPPAEEMKALLEYCARDTLLMAAAWRDLELGAPHPDDAVMEADRAINARGIPIDIDGARALRTTIQNEITEATRGMNVRLLNTPVVFKRWLNQRGCAVKDCTQDEIARALVEIDQVPEEHRDLVRRYLLGRQAIGNIKLSKIDAMLAREVGGRVYGAHEYYGAHTGRWAGRGVQTQNMPKDAKDLRGLIRAKRGKILLAGDFSGVEARGLLWLGDDEEGLDVYRRKEDPYKAAASKMYEKPISEIEHDERQAGKVTTLSLGYQGGVGALLRMAAKFGISIPGDPQELVEAWRDSRPAIAGTRVGKLFIKDDGTGVQIRTGGLWRAFRDAAKFAITAGTKITAGKTKFWCEGTTLLAKLPSGRVIYYRDAEIDEDGMRYRHPQGNWARLYGGKIAENITQAVCRDLMAFVMVTLEEARFPVVMHIHDELCLEIEESRIEEAAAIMQKKPAWAAGFPLDTDFRAGECYE